MRFKSSDKMVAKLDFTQSATGAILAFFIVGHILFEASILISKDFMQSVTLFFEGYYFFGERYPGIISFLAAFLFVVFILHALTAMRKFPAGYREYKVMSSHAKRLNHEDTSLWLIQVATGFVMLFLGSVHLYIMMTQPDQIGPHMSAQRVVGEWMAPLYFFLLLSVVSHAFIGLYRLALKWGFFEGKKPKESRKKMKVLLKVFVALYIFIGLASLAKYIEIGLSEEAKQPYISHAEVQR